MHLHSLFQWMGPNPSAVSVKDLSDFCRERGFSAIPCTSSHSAGDDVESDIAAWAESLRKSYVPNYQMAGSWLNDRRKMTVLMVLPKTAEAHKLWLSGLDSAVSAPQ
jgi:hypothetical protein